jgi:hypothetical protein
MYEVIISNTAGWASCPKVLLDIKEGMIRGEYVIHMLMADKVGTLPVTELVSTSKTRIIHHVAHEGNAVYIIIKLIAYGTKCGSRSSLSPSCTWPDTQPSQGPLPSR